MVGSVAVENRGSRKTAVEIKFKIKECSCVHNSNGVGGPGIDDRIWVTNDRYAR